MPFAMTNQSGMLMSTGPTDVCKTPAPPAPPVPMPYPNMSQMTMANTGTMAKKVSISGSKAATQKTETNMSSGDEPGVAGGVVSNKNMGKCGFLMGSMKVKIEGNPAVRMGDTTKHNNMPNNCVGTAVQPSQQKVQIN